LLVGPLNGLELTASSQFGTQNANFKKVKKVVTSERIERKGVTNFLVDRKIRELKPKQLMCKDINENLNRNFSFKCTSASNPRSYRQKTRVF
jgi:hypothetical protein